MAPAKHRKNLLFYFFVSAAVHFNGRKCNMRHNNKPLGTLGTVDIIACINVARLRH